jgi:hypothetical protein|tara:strand:- start:3252 stop:3449 length:198 start_codon:yes stop_codon:yes gene_type:complete
MAIVLVGEPVTMGQKFPHLHHGRVSSVAIESKISLAPYYVGVSGLFIALKVPTQPHPTLTKFQHF